MSNGLKETSNNQDLIRIQDQIPPRSKYNSIRQWFRAIESQGDFIGIRFGHLTPGQSEPRWIYYAHADYDGIGAFAEILRNCGVELTDLPQIKYYPAYSSIISAVKHWPKYLAPRRELKWKALGDCDSSGDCNYPPTAIAWHIFDENTSLRIRQNTRKIGVTVNTFLLDKLTRALRGWLDKPTASVPWMIPVNMRGGVNQFRDTDNHSSYISVRIPNGQTTVELHRHILKSLSRGEHWGNWHAFKSGKFIGQRLRSLLVAKNLCTAQWSLGAFSNLGEWDTDRRISHPQARGCWLFSPPTLRIQKLAVGFMTFQGRLSLTIQAHPELTTDPTIAKQWIKAWVKEIDIAMAYLATIPPVTSMAA